MSKQLFLNGTDSEQISSCSEWRGLQGCWWWRGSTCTCLSSHFHRACTALKDRGPFLVHVSKHSISLHWQVTTWKNLLIWLSPWSVFQVGAKTLYFSSLLCSSPLLFPFSFSAWPYRVLKTIHVCTRFKHCSVSAMQHCTMLWTKETPTSTSTSRCTPTPRCRCWCPSNAKRQTTAMNCHVLVLTDNALTRIPSAVRLLRRARGVQWKSSPSGTWDWTEGKAVYHPAGLPSVALEKSWRWEAGSLVGWYCRCPLLLCGATFPFVCGWCCVPGGAAVSSLFRVVLFIRWGRHPEPKGGRGEGGRGKGAGGGCRLASHPTLDERREGEERRDGGPRLVGFVISSGFSSFLKKLNLKKNRISFEFVSTDHKTYCFKWEFGDSEEAIILKISLEMYF